MTAYSQYFQVIVVRLFSILYLVILYLRMNVDLYERVRLPRTVKYCKPFYYVESIHGIASFSL